MAPRPNCSGRQTRKTPSLTTEDRLHAYGGGSRFDTLLPPDYGLRRGITFVAAKNIHAIRMPSANVVETVRQNMMHGSPSPRSSILPFGRSNVTEVRAN